MLKAWYRFWAAWVIGGIVMDVIAFVLFGRNYTLSIYTRKVFRLEPDTPRRRLGQVIIAGFVTWLGVHVIGDCLEPLPYWVSGDYRREQRILKDGLHQ